MKIARIVLLAVTAVLLAPTAAQAQIKVFTFSGLVTSSISYYPMYNNEFASYPGKTITGTISYYLSMQPSFNNGQVNDYYNAATLTVVMDGITASGTGDIHSVYNGSQELSFRFFPSGGFPTFSLRAPGYPTSSSPSLPRDLSNQAFTFNASVYSGGIPSNIFAGQIGGAVVFDASAVPEAATWAMMIAGFGAVGSAVRRRSNGRPVIKVA